MGQRLPAYDEKREGGEPELRCRVPGVYPGALLLSLLGALGPPQLSLSESQHSLFSPLLCNLTFKTSEL